MARRPESDPVLSREDLEAFKRKLTMLSVPGVEGVYATTHNECRFQGRVPPAAAIQQLVAAWKVLRRMHKK